MAYGYPKTIVFKIKTLTPSHVKAGEADHKITKHL